MPIHRHEDAFPPPMLSGRCRFSVERKSGRARTRKKRNPKHWFSRRPIFATAGC